MDGAQKLVDAIVWASIHPTKKFATGWKAQGAVIGDQIWPGLAEHLAGNMIHRSPVETAPSAPPTVGSVQQPVPQGTTVEGSTRARMAREDQERREREGR